MAVRNRYRATANGCVHPRDTGQLAVLAAHDQPLIVRHTRRCRVIGMDDDLGDRTEKCQLRVEPAHLASRNEHQRSRLPQGIQLVDENLRGETPAAQPLDVPVHPRRGQLAIGLGPAVRHELVVGARPPELTCASIASSVASVSASS